MSVTTSNLTVISSGFRKGNVWLELDDDVDGRRDLGWFRVRDDVREHMW